MADLIVETGAIVAGANSYCTADEADVYFEKRLHTSTWDNSDSDSKEKALMWATRLLDEQVAWNGTAVHDGQPLRFPRDGVYDVDGNEISHSIVPQWLKDATAEFAMHLMVEDRTLETNRDMTGLRRIRVDTIEIEASPTTMSVAKPTIPPSVWSIIRRYGKSIGSGRQLARM